jgi:hypothetical protein
MQKMGRLSRNRNAAKAKFGDFMSDPRLETGTISMAPAVIDEALNNPP